MGFHRLHLRERPATRQRARYRQSGGSETAESPTIVGRRRRSPVGLRARVTLGFAAGALVLSGALAAITYFTTSTSILNQARTSIQDLAYSNARAARQALQRHLIEPIPSNVPTTSIAASLGQVIPALLGEINGGTVTETQSLIYVSSTWYHYPTTFTQSNLPAALVAYTKSGTPAEQFFSYAGVPRLAVGVPLPAVGAIYIGVFDLASTAHTLSVLLATLVSAAIATTVAGAILGRWAAARALRPLRDVSQAALAIASGRLGTRLETADVSDLAVLASSFNRMVDRLQQRIERDARFTSDVSHELRSPLTTLAASLSVLEARRDDLPDRSQQALDLLGTEVRRFQRMVGDLLEISKIDAGSARLDGSVVEIGELVRRACSAPGARAVPVELRPGVEHTEVVVEKRRFERIIANLLENAQRYAGGATRVVVETRDSTVRIAVEDAGPGVPVSDRERIFERFSRGTGDAGKRGSGVGTGLGLALVTEHVKMHGGRVFIEDFPGGGARFVVELPTARSASSPVPSAEYGTPDDPGTQDPGTQDPRIQSPVGASGARPDRDDRVRGETRP